MVTTEPPHIALFDHTEIKAGMVITIEPTVARNYGHFKMESDVLVVENGYEVLSVASWELIKI
jgi:Xaa-Pro aminopeptidase